MNSMVRSCFGVALGLALASCGGGGYGGGGGGVVPTALSAGADQTVTGSTTVNLVGSCTGTYCGVLWTQTGGTAVTLSGASTLNASFVAPAPVAPETLTFQVAVQGTCTGTCSDSVSITVNPIGATVQISGTIRYELVPHNATTHALNYAAITPTAVRGATILARAGNAANTCTAGTLLANSTTNASGGYSLAVPLNTVLKICVRAELLLADAGAGSPSWDVQVVDNTASSAIYVLESAAATSGAANSVRNLTAASGWGGAGYTSTRAAAPFAILDDVYMALQKMLSVEPTIDLPALDLNWSINNINSSGNPALGQIGTSFYSNDEIYILGEANDDTDEYDDHVIIHEYGHYVEDNLSRSDSIGGSHSTGDLLDARIAYGEGFGNAWSGIVTDDPVYQDSLGNLQSTGFSINVETETVSPAQTGWFNETSVQRVLYDLYDTTNEPTNTNGVTTVNTGDTGSIGLAALWNTWRNLQSTTPVLTSIFSLLDGARASAPGSVAFINALAAANGINGSDALGTGESNAGGTGNAAALPLYTAYTIGGGSVPICVTNNDGTYNALGNRRFLSFTVATGNRTFSVTAPAGTDADAVLYSAGNIVGAIHQSNGNESWAISPLVAGNYVLEVYACENVFLPAPGNLTPCGGNNVAGNRCLTVGIN